MGNIDRPCGATTPRGSRANGCTAAPSSVILTPFTLSLPHTSTMMMISNMKSDQAKFNIEINNDKKFEQPNFDRLCGGSNPAWFSDCQEKGEKQIQQDAAARNSIYEPLSINYKKNTTPPYYFYPFFLSKLLKKKKIIAAKNQKKKFFPQKTKKKKKKKKKK